MKTFKDLVFEPHPLDPHCSKQATMGFSNGYGISVILLSDVITSRAMSYEAAVLRNNRLCYSTPVTDDVIMDLTDEGVSDVMRKIQELPKV